MVPPVSPWCLSREKAQTVHKPGVISCFTMSCGDQKRCSYPDAACLLLFCGSKTQALVLLGGVAGVVGVVHCKESTYLHHSSKGWN